MAFSLMKLRLIPSAKSLSPCRVPAARSAPSRYIVVKHVRLLIRDFHVLLRIGVVFRWNAIFRNDVCSRRTRRLIGRCVSSCAPVSCSDAYPIAAWQEAVLPIDLVLAVRDRRALLRSLVARQRHKRDQSLIKRLTLQLDHAADLLPAAVIGATASQNHRRG